MEIRHMETFLRVVMTGSYTKAAASLGLSQPTVSARVASLEDELGRQLFDRRGNTMALSLAGETFRPYAEEVLRLSREAHQSVSAVDRSRRSLGLRIGANSATAGGPLPGWLSAFSKRLRNPRLRVDVHVDKTSALMEALMLGAIQLAFVNPKLAHKKAVQLWQEEYPLLLVVPHNHRFRDQTIQLNDLREENFVSPEFGIAASQLGIVEQRLNTRLRTTARSNSSSLLFSLMRQGKGVGFFPECVVAKHLADGLLATAQIEDYDPDPMVIALVRWTDARLSETDLKLVEMLATGAHE